MPQVPVMGNVVDEFMQDNVKIRICDDSIVKTPAEVDAILNRVAMVGYGAATKISSAS